jgi:hypothetical protein
MRMAFAGATCSRVEELGRVVRRRARVGSGRMERARAMIEREAWHQVP